MSAELKPRYEPTWSSQDDQSELIAHVGPLDVYYEYNYEGNDEHWVMVVAPGRRCKDPANRPHNFDVYKVEGSNLVSEDDYCDIHIELHEMCKVYALCVKHGILKLEEAA